MPVEERQEAPRRADFDLIRELAALLSETGLSEIEIGEGPDRIRVARKLMGSTVAVVPAAAPLAETLAAEDHEPHSRTTRWANRPDIGRKWRASGIWRSPAGARVARSGGRMSAGLNNV